MPGWSGATDNSDPYNSGLYNGGVHNGGVHNGGRLHASSLAACHRRCAQASGLSQGLSVQGRSSGVVEHGGDVLLCFLGPEGKGDFRNPR